MFSSEIVLFIKVVIHRKSTSCLLNQGPHQRYRIIISLNTNWRLFRNLLKDHYLNYGHSLIEGDGLCWSLYWWMQMAVHPLRLGTSQLQVFLLIEQSDLRRCHFQRSEVNLWKGTSSRHLLWGKGSAQLHLVSLPGPGFITVTWKSPLSHDSQRSPMNEYGFGQELQQDCRRKDWRTDTMFCSPLHAKCSEKGHDNLRNSPPV